MFLAVVCMACAGISAPAQSLFDEIIYDGETVTADSAMVKAEAAAPVVEASRPQPRQRTLPRRQSRRGKAKTPPSLWDLTDSEGFPLDSLMLGPPPHYPDS